MIWLVRTNGSIFNRKEVTVIGGGPDFLSNDRLMNGDSLERVVQSLQS